jgi:hypothetical protein
MTAPKSFFEVTKWLFPVGAISLMLLALAGCNSREDEVPAQSAAMAANPSEATESQPPSSKKDEAPAQSAVTSEKPFEVTYCQLLLNEAEVVEQGIDRQRRMYPRGSKLRISAQAVEEGFNAATRKEAMACFNQAWRFNPENPMAYWGAGIIRGLEAKKFSENNMIDIARKYWDDCLKLFESAEKLIDNVPQEKVFFQIHLAKPILAMPLP